MSIEAQQFWDALKRKGFTFLSGVPDSTFGASYNVLLKDPGIRYVPAVREDVALGVASAAHLSGSKGGIVIQNSGIGNIVNGLTSFNLLYKVPVLLVVGWRGFGGYPNDAPEHWIMGEKTVDFLNLMGIPNRLVEEDTWMDDIDHVVSSMEASSIPGALLIRSGVLG